MTRDEALKKAIRYASTSTGDSPERVEAMAWMTMAWIAIHDRLPGPPVPESGDTAVCGHGITAMWSGNAWVHPASMALCANPPVPHA
jgi:hypothetical protein